MRTKSVYQFECLCGEKITSESRTVTCSKCGRLIEIQWGKE